MVLQLRDTVCIRGTKVKGKIVKIRREFASSGRKIPIYEIKVDVGEFKGRIVQEKRRNLKIC